MLSPHVKVKGCGLNNGLTFDLDRRFEDFIRSRIGGQ